jgi:hypothetical protein
MNKTTHKSPFELFMFSAEKAGFGFRNATSKERDEDIDLVLWPYHDTKKAFAVALKKTILKKSSKRKQLWGWVELTNRFGGSGWLYSKCTFVVYERKDDFVLIHKKDLRLWAEKENLPRIDLPFVSNSWAASYRSYRRPNTMEVIFQVKVSDALKKCRHHLWKKHERDS